jgi:S1/P1 Nuclease
VKHHIPAILWLLAVLAVPADEALAWGEEGHRMVGDIASRYLTPVAARQVALLLQRDRLADRQLSQRRTLGEVADWADEIKDYPWGRRLASWHYDDLPVCGAADPLRYCRSGRCASAQLARQIAILGDAQAPLRERNEALKWVVHLMGDIHQPLHAATRRDRGGNQIEVSFFGQRDNPPYGPLNLHAAWDVQMVQRLVAERGGEGAIVSAPVGAADRAAWERGAIADWIAESHRLAADVAYSFLPARLACGGKVRGVVAIDRAYYSRAAPVIELQIRKAGVRLAFILNRTLAR